MEVEGETASRARMMERTRCLDGKLLIDHLLELAGVQNDESWLYPPQTEMQEASLMRMVEESTVFPLLEKNCLKFYLYLDQSKQAALDFARESCIPKSFVKSTTGYWQLDHVQISAGVKSLSFPGVVPDFLPSILHLLSVSPKDLVAFIRQAQVSLDSSLAVQAVVEAFVRVGDPSEALRWARTTGNMHTQLVRLALSTALGANQTGVIIKSAMQALLNAPFDEFEDSIVLSYARNPPADLKPANRDMLAEWILTRLIAQGRYIEASKLVDAPSLKPSDNAAARKRALLKKGLFSIMSELDTSILETEQQESAPITNGVDHPMEEDSVAQLPWAPSIATEKATDQRNIPLSASPAFRASGDSRAIKHVVEALRLGSPMRKTSFGTPQCPQSPMGASYSATAGSPFVPRVQDKPVNRGIASQYNSPAPQKSLPAQMRLQRDQAYQSPARQQSPARPASPAQIPLPRDQSPAPSQQQQPISSKRSAPEPRSKAGRQKMRAVEMEVDEEEAGQKEELKQEEVQQRQKPATPSRRALPGAFGSTSDNEEEAAPAPEPESETQEEEDEVPEMRQVKNSSPVSKVSTSSRKPRHVRGTAPEPPTPAQPIRRSKRISAASREQSREPVSPPTVKKPARGKKASGRSKRAGSVASDISEAQ